jgi:hypothetical protein
LAHFWENMRVATDCVSANYFHNSCKQCSSAGAFCTEVELLGKLAHVIILGSSWGVL